MLIAKVNELQFPTILVNWYSNKYDPFVSEKRYSHVSKKELIFSSYEDWQYIESVKSKIRIVDEKTYWLMNPFERSDQKTFFCRSYILPESHFELDKLPKSVCHCMVPFNPDDLLVTCTLCGLVFHPACSGADELCIMCHD
jgi:hypothetical protein